MNRDEVKKCQVNFEWVQASEVRRHDELIHQEASGAANVTLTDVETRLLPTLHSLYYNCQVITCVHSFQLHAGQLCLFEGSAVCPDI